MNRYDEMQSILKVMTNHQNHLWRRAGSPDDPEVARTFLNERQLEKLQ